MTKSKLKNVKTTVFLTAPDCLRRLSPSLCAAAVFRFIVFLEAQYLGWKNIDLVWLEGQNEVENISDLAALVWTFYPAACVVFCSDSWFCFGSSC